MEKRDIDRALSHARSAVRCIKRDLKVAVASKVDVVVDGHTYIGMTEEFDTKSSAYGGSERQGVFRVQYLRWFLPLVQRCIVADPASLSADCSVKRPGVSMDCTDLLDRMHSAGDALIIASPDPHSISGCASALAYLTARERSGQAEVRLVVELYDERGEYVSDAITTLEPGKTLQQSLSAKRIALIAAGAAGANTDQDAELDVIALVADILDGSGLATTEISDAPAPGVKAVLVEPDAGQPLYKAVLKAGGWDAVRAFAERDGGDPAAELGIRTPQQSLLSQPKPQRIVERVVERVEVEVPVLPDDAAAQVAALERQVDSLQAKLDNLQVLRDREASDAAAKCRALQAALESVPSPAPDSDAATVFYAMDIPKTPADALGLAARAFPSRLLVLPRAFDSAQDYSGCSASEVWAVLRDMAAYLHPAVFSDCRDVVGAFNSQSCFELSLSEGCNTKESSEFMRLRSVDYKGRERDMSAHVKGKPSRTGQSLRVHWFADRDDRLIVVAHCGYHLKSFGTRFLH